MNILKTLDRLAGFASCIAALPVAATVSAATFAVDIIGSTRSGKEAKEATWVMEVMHQCSKTMAFAIGHTMKHGAIGAITNKESRLNALRQSAIIMSVILEIPVEKVMEMSYYKLMYEEYSKEMTFTQYLESCKTLQERIHSEALLEGMVWSWQDVLSNHAKYGVTTTSS